MPFAGQNYLFLHGNKFFCLFPSLTEKKKEKRKETHKNNTKKHAETNDFDQQTACEAGQNTQHMFYY